MACLCLASLASEAEEEPTSGLEAALFGLASPSHDGTPPGSELRARPRRAAGRSSAFCRGAASHAGPLASRRLRAEAAPPLSPHARCVLLSDAHAGTASCAVRRSAPSPCSRAPRPGRHREHPDGAGLAHPHLAQPSRRPATLLSAACCGSTGRCGSALPRGCASSHQLQGCRSHAHSRAKCPIRQEREGQG